MERESIDYKAYLMSLVKSLDLEDYVEFRGFVKREIIYSELNSIEYVFISLSLHSDENFGMAALRSLSDGKKAILSNWGGHADFDKSFPNQVLLIDVEGGSDGPYIDPVSVISSIEECCHFIPLEINAIPKKYQRESITARLKAISEKISSLPLVALKHSAWAEAILQKRNSFALNKLGKGTKIFNDYCDQKSHLFFSVYGMGDNAIKPITYDLYLIPPWVKISNDIITIEDPHKGFFQIEMTAPTDNEILVKIVTINDSIVLITQSNCLKLIQSGHAFPFGDKND